MIHHKSIIGAILAGGQHRRMGAQPKWQLRLGKRLIIEHIIERLQPQTDRIIINGHHPELANYADTLVPDDIVPSEGPLSGLLASLHYAQQHHYPWLATCPCDAPIFPEDYIQQLINGLSANSLCAIAEYQGKPQPIFGVWSVKLIPLLENHLHHSQQRSIQGWINTQSIPCQTVALTACQNSSTKNRHPSLMFANINTPEQWQEMVKTYSQPA